MEQFIWLQAVAALARGAFRRSGKPLSFRARLHHSPTLTCASTSFHDHSLAPLRPGTTLVLFRVDLAPSQTSSSLPLNFDLDFLAPWTRPRSSTPAFPLTHDHQTICSNGTQIRLQRRSRSSTSVLVDLSLRPGRSLFRRRTVESRRRAAHHSEPSSYGFRCSLRPPAPLHTPGLPLDLVHGRQSALGARDRRHRPFSPTTTVSRTS